MISYELGCRYFEVSYPFDISELGKCIVSNIPENFDHKNKMTLDDLKDIKLSNVDLKLLDLNDRVYETDTKIIKQDCQCFTCKSNYTRAYIHHLLKCKELNANLLLIL